MISAIGETQEKRNSDWDKATDVQREKYKREMEAWTKKYPFAAMMMSDVPYEEKLKYAENRFNGKQ